jgi:Flp pilus assembly protein TadD
MLLEGKDLIAAGQHLQKLLSDCPTHAEGLLLQGVLCMQREQYREAEHAFSLALRQGADRKKCLMGIGMAALGRAYAQGAWEQFLQVLAEHPDDAEAIHWLLRAGTAQNRWAELCGHLRHYLSRNPGDRAVRFALAGVLVRAERIEEARREHDTLRALAPEYDGLAELGRMIAAQETVLAMGNEEASSHWGMKMS